ncbi:hypothetical protein M231_00160 [Tremella mesenterica]|uniref:Protein phosphatase 4 regulatory subunit 1 n=1 Tax=Tremella mesenterica TaxID=5217 RepID=A0A4Q1BWZ4_TREME|nr:hypothetical protein M231_00160 [Tremella mesenterica]
MPFSIPARVVDEAQDDPKHASPSHGRSSSLTSPPPPPMFFNPPPAYPYEPPVATISPPTTSPPASSANLTLKGQLGALFGEEKPRPTPRPVQRLSSESATSPGSWGSKGSYGSTGSSQDPESSEHLAEARAKLLSETPNPSAPTSRRQSESSGVSGKFDLHIISPTPPLIPRGLEDDPEEGPTKPVATAVHVPQPPEPEELVHAWDSVWPTSGAPVRPSPSDPGPSRFPIAPMSPFVTPTFSPAAMPQPSAAGFRRPSPPVGPHGRSGSPSPLRFSPHGSPGVDDRSSPKRDQSPVPSPTAIRHRRSASHSSPTGDRPWLSHDRLGKEGSVASPPWSPLRPPGQLPAVKSSEGRVEGPLVARALQRNNSGSGLKLSDTGQTSPRLPATAGITGRPRGKSLSNRGPVHTPSPSALASAKLLERRDSRSSINALSRTSSSSSTHSPLPPSVESLALAETSLEPIALPPAVSLPPVPTSEITDVEKKLIRVTSPPLFAPVARPAKLRRALSDYEAAARPGLRSFAQSLNSAADTGLSTKRSLDDAALPSPSISMDNGAPPLRLNKSPRISPHILPPISATLSGPKSPFLGSGPFEDKTPINTGDLGELPGRFEEFGLYDEGDMLPVGVADLDMDVTFDDEGLSQLERIFLLSKSEYPFHRAYVARMLADLLEEVDPCESVEYVLPLLINYSLDADDSVKESFAGELHKVLWYFFSRCNLVETEVDTGEEGHSEVTTPLPLPIPVSQAAVTVTSEGMRVIPKPSVEDDHVLQPKRDATLSPAPGNASAGSSLRAESATMIGTPDRGTVDTPNSLSIQSDDTAFSPHIMVPTRTVDDQGDQDGAKAAPVLCPPPTLSVHVFTPLLCSLLLSSHAAVVEAVRVGLIAILSRLRDRPVPDPNMWKSEWHDNCECNERRTFLSQDGPHAHDLMPMSRSARNMVERCVVDGIILGMGRLTTVVPENLFDDTDDPMGQGVDSETDQELLQAQLMQEANAGRAMSMLLIGTVAELYDPHELVEVGFLHEILRSRDGDEEIRAEGALALAQLAKLCPVEYIQEMLPLFDDYLVDPSLSVRQSICFSLPVLCRRIEDSQSRRDLAVRGAITLAQSDAWQSILEVLGEVIHCFISDPLGPPKELLEIFCDDSSIPPLSATDTDWDVLVAYNFPGVCLTLGADRWPELLPLLERIVHRAGARVMTTISSFLHELSRILRPDQVAPNLLPIFHRCLGHSDATRERSYEHLDVFLSGLPSQEAWDLFSFLAEKSKTDALGGWRAREKLALHVPAFLTLFPEDYQASRILEMTHSALIDKFACVRDAVTLSVPRTYDLLRNRPIPAEAFRRMILDLGDSGIYKHRQTFVRCIREFARPPPNRKVFEQFFLPFLPRLTQDVIDVRLSLAQMVANLFVVGAFYGFTGPKDPGFGGEDMSIMSMGENGQVIIPAAMERLATALADDESSEVRDTLRNVLDRLSHGKEVGLIGVADDTEQLGSDGGKESLNEKGEEMEEGNPFAEAFEDVI